jgi:succinate dehydrogenase / fumarate reductase membrane anchor subunit
MLWLAMLHGTNGVRTIINDYAEKDSTRRWLKTVLYSATVVIIVLGTLVIFTFDPCPVVDGVPLPGGFCPA